MAGEPDRRAPLRLRLLLGTLTVWACAYAVVALSSDIGLVPDDGTGSAGDRLVANVGRAASAANALGLLLLYAWLALKDSGLRSFDRVAWVFAMMFFYPAALPLFWYLRIWRDRPAPPDA